MKIFSLAAFLAGLFCLSSAPAHSPSANSDADESANSKAELLAIHQAARRAHFNRDVDFIVAGIGSEFTTVHEGNIRVMSREDVRRLIGKPREVWYFPARDEETWTWRYRDINYRLFNVLFDRSGAMVRSTLRLDEVLLLDGGRAKH